MILTRFKRGESRVKMIRDPVAAHHYFVLTTSPEVQRVEHFDLQDYPMQCDLYLSHGYERLVLCPQCKGTGVMWYPDRQGDACHDVCDVCQGEGGHSATDTSL